MTADIHGYCSGKTCQATVNQWKRGRKGVSELRNQNCVKFAKHEFSLTRIFSYKDRTEENKEGIKKFLGIPLHNV